MSKYFHIRQMNGRKVVYRVYKTDFHHCELMDSFKTEDDAKDCVKELSNDNFR